MFQENKAFRKKVDETARISISIPEKWQKTDRPYAFTPRDINVSFGSDRAYFQTKVFLCYFTLDKRVLRVTHLKPSYDFSPTNAKIKGVVDAYLNKVMLAFIEHAKLMQVDKLVIESSLPMAVDSFLDLGFKTNIQGEGVYVGEICL